MSELIVSTQGSQISIEDRRNNLLELARAYCTNGDHYPYEFKPTFLRMLTRCFSARLVKLGCKTSELYEHLIASGFMIVTRENAYNKPRLIFCPKHVALVKERGMKAFSDTFGHMPNEVEVKEHTDYWFQYAIDSHFEPDKTPPLYSRELYRPTTFSRVEEVNTAQKIDNPLVESTKSSDYSDLLSMLGGNISNSTESSTES